nr:twitching motility protein [Desulfobulbaceae bacterium]
MAQLKLKSNQAALILEVSPEGEVSVEAAFPEEVDEAGDLAGAICTVIGQKLTEDEAFQDEVMSAIEDSED